MYLPNVNSKIFVGVVDVDVCPPDGVEVLPPPPAAGVVVAPGDGDITADCVGDGLVVGVVFPPN